MRWPATCALTIALFVGAGVPAATAQPVAPDLSGYQAVAPDTYVDGGEAYFQTPDGLLCAIRPAQGMAGCDGPLPGAPVGANQIVLSADMAQRGLRATANPLFVKPAGAAAPVLPAGHKLVLEDFECAVGDSESAGKTLCVKGTPAIGWMEIGPSETGVGPGTPDLPAGFPDPKDFVVGDESFVVGSGPKNIFPVFTVGDLTCKIELYSGGEIACDGTLPGVHNGDDEVYVRLPGGAGTRKAASPSMTVPAYPGTVRELPAGHRIDSYGGTCLAGVDGVACFGTLAGQFAGFQVDADAVHTYGATG